MGLLRENIEYSKNLPVKMFLHSVQLVQSHWHDSLEILFILKGHVELFLNGESRILNEDDVAIFPSSTIHAISSNEQNTILALQISPELLNEYVGKGYSFYSPNFNVQNDESYTQIRNIMAKMMIIYNKRGLGFELKLNSLALELLYMIIMYNSSLENTIEPQTQKYIKRMQRIIDYINKNFQNEITLSSLQQIESLSTAYISKFFHKYMGVSFLTYINSLRLQYAERVLIETDVSITQLALDSGFPNQKAFFKAFKNAYHQTPKNYRKKHTSMIKTLKKGLNYFEIDGENALEHLFKYINTENVHNVNNVIGVHNTIIVDGSVKCVELKHTWKNLITVARAKDLLYAPVREQLAALQKDVHFKYIRFHGIFNDSMMVYDEDKNGDPVYNFIFVDEVIDYLYSINIRPFVELGFMPNKMANENKYLFYDKMCMSMPKTQKLWDDLVHAFVVHCLTRYGKNEVSKWLFEVWNEPDMENIFWHGTWNEYLDFYRSTYKTIKNILPMAKVGGPSVIVIPNYERDYIYDFIKYGEKEGCIPDFISVHSYPGDLEDLGSFNIVDFNFEDILKFDDSLANNFPLPQKCDSLKNNIEMAIKSINMDIPLHITEFNGDAWSRNLSHDTCYQATFIVKNILENIDMAESFGYWTLSDCMEERRIGNYPFFGNFGLYTVQGIPKPGAIAFSMISKLGNKLLKKGDGYFVTKSEHGYQILLYNYCHFDELFRKRDTSLISITNRYGVFNDIKKDFKIIIENIDSGKYRKEFTILNRENGSAFDLWVELGAPKSLTTEHINYLKKMATPRKKGSIVECEGTLTLTHTLCPHEICLITLEHLI